MKKEICILEGNCQADALNILLGATPAFARRFEIVRTVNYQDLRPSREITDTCKLYLYQYLGGKWGKESSANQLGRLPGNATTLCVPNMFFKGYWPFWTHIPDIIEFGDSALESLLAMGLADQDILRVYARCPPSLLGDPLKVVEETLAREREKEKRTPVKYVHLIEEYWREKQVFLTINHPAEFLLLHAANEILRLLGLGPLPQEIARNFRHPHGEFLLPIHPVPARELGLAFAGADRKYPCFNKTLTYREFAAYYLACRANGIISLRDALSQ